MRKLLLGLCLLACLSTTTLAQTPAPPTPPAKPPIRLPVVVQPLPIPPSPAPAGTPVPLTKDMSYVFDADVPCIVKANPPGLVTITQDAGPLKYKAHFADDPAKSQCRKFEGQYVYTVDAVGKGNVSLLVIPAGVKSDADIQSVALAVDDGVAPTPPAPPVPPAPTPDSTFVAAVKAAYASEPASSKAVDAPRLAFLYDDMIRSIVTDPATKTWGDFLKGLVAQRKQMIADRMPAVRKVIDGLFQSKFPTQPGAAFDDAARKLATDVLTEAANALKGAQ